MNDMKMTMTAALFLSGFLCFADPSGISAQDVPRYVNPVSDVSLPDPTVIDGGDGFFYLYATEDIRNVPVFRSRDLVSWEQAGAAFTAETRPRLADGGGNVWAPDINRTDGGYVLYYTLSKWGEEHRNGVGVAVADSPEGAFTDLGLMFTSDGIGVRNSIDQCCVVDGGRKYLFWGSFRGLYAIELSPDGLSVMPDAQKTRVAGTAYEAVYIHKKDDSYYMFASTGSCCEGVKSTYTVVVGRSDSLFGPYLDRVGETMLENHHEVVLRGNERFRGPGHNARLVTDNAGDDWMLYHAVDTANPKGRKLMLDRVDWNDGWPVVGDGTPSLTSASPVF